jgi:type IV secretion system protein VirD4
MEILGFFALVWWAAVAMFGWLGHSARKEQKKRYEEACNFTPAAAHGSARFADEKDLEKAGLFKEGGIHIGFFRGAKGKLRKLYANSSGHLLLMAGARSGKLVTVLASAVLSLPKKYSLAIFDPKAEITCICAHYLKASGRDVYVLNPFGIWLDRMKGLKQATFNPLSSLDPKSLSFHADCDKITDAIFYQESFSADSHWGESGELLTSGVIAALVKYGAPEDRNLVAVRNVITGANGHTVYEFCRECMALPDIFIRQKLGRFAAQGAEDNKELNSIVSTADTKTGWIGNEAIAQSLKGGANEISFRDLKRNAGTAICICLPLDKLDVSSNWFRVLAATMISDTLNEGLRGKGAPVVAVLDEVFQVGYLKVLADAWGMAAGAASLQLWAVYQDVSQIQSQFKTCWSTMIQNSGTAAYFGIRDYQSSEFVSRQCGVTEVISASRSISINPRLTVNDSFSQAARPLLHPDEVRFALGPEDMLLFADKLPGVCWAARKPYFECEDLKGKYRDNPYFQPVKKHGGGMWSWLFQ